LTDTTCWHVPGGNHLSPEPQEAELGDGARPCCCQNEFRSIESSTHDAEFLRLVAEFVATQVPERTNLQVTIDSTRVYFTGHGNGCTMALTMAVLQSNFVAAVCCTAGSFLTPPSADYSPTPVWNLFGEEDIMIPYEGFYDPNYGLIYPDVLATFKKISKLNNCGEFIRSEENIPDMDLDDDQGKLIRDIASRCDMNATVEFVTLTTAGHTLQLTYDTEGEMYPTYASRTTVDTASLAWEFCHAHTLSSTTSVSESDKHDSLRMKFSLPPAWSPLAPQSAASRRTFRLVWISLGLTYLYWVLTLDVK
jgi:poly(3-hydroxybutyrate) depolymerase